MADDPNTLLDRFDEQNRQALQYGRHRFLWTWLAVGLLAMLTAVALEVAIRTAHRQNESVKVTASDASATADSAQASNDEVVKYLKGEQGIPGVPGANGTTGSPGLPSSEPGPEGPRGVAGPAGPAGTAGPAGAASTVPGPAGATGTAGPAGTAGEAGAAGEKGAQGPQGAKGEKGDTGPQGPRGDTGAAGPIGPAGPASTITSGTVGAASANDTTAQKNVIATCATGRVTGGGYAIIPATALIVPTTSSTVGNGWQVTANASPAFTGNWQAFAFAVCSQ